MHGCGIEFAGFDAEEVLNGAEHSSWVCAELLEGVDTESIPWIEIEIARQLLVVAA